MDCYFGAIFFFLFLEFTPSIDPYKNIAKNYQNSTRIILYANRIGPHRIFSQRSIQKQHIHDKHTSAIKNTSRVLILLKRVTLVRK